VTPKIESPVQHVENPDERFMVLKLSQLAFDSLAGKEADGEQGGSRGLAATRMATAIRFYLGDRDAERPAWPYPAFLRGSEVREDVALSLNIEAGQWRAFEAESRRQDVSVQQLAEHAAFYLAAELEAGRITQRILDDLEAADDPAGEQ
jgi:hypothetical protein